MKATFYRILRWVVDSAGSVMLAISVTVAFIAVIARYVLQIPTWWAFSIQHYSFLFVIYLGAIVSSRERTHVRIEALEDFIKRTGLRLKLRAGTLIIALCGIGIFTYHSYEFMLWATAQPQHDIVLKWFHLAIVKSLPFVAGIAMFLYGSLHLVGVIRQLFEMRATSGSGER
jgi:TRAP-type C4-dicarboxylate transport system permease small subunit